MEENIKVILEDENISHIRASLILDDGTVVVVYSKENESQIFVLVGEFFYGPFLESDIYSYILNNHDKEKITKDSYIFSAKNLDGKKVYYKRGLEIDSSAPDFSWDEIPIEHAIGMYADLICGSDGIDYDFIENFLAENENQEFDDPYIRKQKNYYYFEINNQSFGPYSYIWNYEVMNAQNYQFVYVSPFDETKLYYNLNGKVIACFDVPEKKIEASPYFVSCYKACYSESGKAVFSNLFDSCIYIDGEKVDYFNGECEDISFFEKNSHVLCSGKKKVFESYDLDTCFWYDGKLHKDWVFARLLKNGNPLYTKRTVNEETGNIELTWHYGDKQISVPVRVYEQECFVTFEKDLISYIREGCPYIYKGGKEYKGFRVNNDYVLYYDNVELKLWKNKKEFDFDEELAEYLYQNDLMAGAGSVQNQND